MLTDKAMNRIDARRTVQRRSAGHGMRIAAHTFRASSITAYLEASWTLENAQVMAAHESRANSAIAQAQKCPVPSPNRA